MNTLPFIFPLIDGANPFFHYATQTLHICTHRDVDLQSNKAVLPTSEVP